ncbi:flagellar hook-length control protein FliK [Aquipseudomonas ullengensis]|uniref:Flagellar hook-length control protein FliK n=1 Tax=Aquipseudomonas ullengensis TaxID=2759166 RepID=A0A7W4QET3_9GAMM|nr:flagellar hook-length control protein FliK [Pseudomonas ullengensis]MBB2495903.1 flagellar hook-length control protein FliK [Pseudomonas ullengensis]
MSVAPDFLLQSAPEIRPKAAPAKAPDNSAEPVKNEGSSFADVYAKERQVKAAERKEAAAKASQAKTDEAPPADDQAVAAAAEEPVVAESGNDLPSDEDDGEEALVDPLLLMAMTGQLPGEDAAVAAPVQADPAADAALQAALLPVTPAVSSGAQATMTEASHDPELDMLNSLPGVKLALEVGAQNQANAQAQLSPGALAAQKAVSSNEGFANALAAFAGDSVTTEEGKLEKLDSAESLVEGLDSLPSVREGQTDARADALASKLNALSQAISQQNTVSQRLPLVPGQAVPMQQGGWSEAVVDRVMWLSSQNLKSAEIQLDPADLGRLEVRIEINKDQTQVTFASPNAGVRDQLEGQMHRLRELFAQQGTQLDVNVSDQSLARGWQGQGGGEESRRQGSGSQAASSADEERLTGISEIRGGAAAAAPRGLVDYYA